MPEQFSDFAKSSVAGTISGTGNFSLSVADGSSFPTSDFFIVVDPNDPVKKEIMHVSTRSGNTFTVDARGLDGTSAQTHTSGAMVIHGVLARHIQGFNDSILAIIEYLGSSLSTVHHGTNAATPRPDVSDTVLWIGTVEPANKVLGDIWLFPDGAYGPLIHTGYAEGMVTANATGATTINVLTANVYDLTLKGNISVTLTSPPSGNSWSLTLLTRQDATGGRTITWPTSVRWPEGKVPTPDTASHKVNIWALATVDGGVTWYAYLSGKGF